MASIIVTCGVRQIWEKVLQKYGLFNRVKVIGGGRLTDGFVVTGEVKASLVSYLRTTHNLYVWSFGDSPLDLGMMKNADKAVVVVGSMECRSKTMEPKLLEAIDKVDLRARQVLLPSGGPPRLDSSKLPVTDLGGSGFDTLSSR